jgi:hypothetical protein
MSNRKAYTKPALIELGKASKLTLGNDHCGIDSYCCKREAPPVEN